MARCTKSIQSLRERERRLNFARRHRRLRVMLSCWAVKGSMVRCASQFRSNGSTTAGEAQHLELMNHDIFLFLFSLSEQFP